MLYGVFYNRTLQQHSTSTASENVNIIIKIHINVFYMILSENYCITASIMYNCLYS
jgi:hypothetical protein